MFNFLMTTTNVVDPLVKLLGEWGNKYLSQISIVSILVRLLISILCGGVLGAERAMKRHAAGFRTYILVSVGAAMAGFTNQFIVDTFENGDAARLGAAVITGIGFLGAGTMIVTSRNQIKGLTTAAALWACACMGLSIGLGFYTLGIVAAILIFMVLTLIPSIENYFIDRARQFTIYVELNARTDLRNLVSYLREKGFQISNVEHNLAYASSGLSVYNIAVIAPYIKGKKPMSQKEIANDVSQLDYVNHAEVIL